MKNNKKLIILFITIFAILSCSKKEVKNNKEGLNVVSTIFPIYDFTRAIAKDKVDLSMLVKPGIEIHSYNPTPADIIAVENSDVFIYIGGEGEAWVEKILDSIYTNNKKIIKLIDNVVALNEEIVEGMQEDGHNHDEHEEEVHTEDEHNHNEEEHHHHHEAYDEHIWTSPKNAILIVNTITKALSELDPTNADYYKENALSYNKEIAQIDVELREVVDNAKRKRIVFGDRFPFRYLAYDYNLEYRAPFSGCSAQLDIAPKTVTYLLDYIKSNDIPYLYYIELSNEKIANLLAEQTGAKKLKLHSGQNVSREEFNSGVTYISIMRDNIESLKIGLN